MSSEMEKLFETKSFDASVWHGFPMGRHGIGRLAPRSFQAEDKKSDPAAVAAVDTNLSNLASDADAGRHPALAVASGALVIIDALQLWVEGEGVGKELLRRIEWHWHPHYISGLWSGGGISIAVEACMTGGDEALVRVTVTNGRTVDFQGELIACGDNRETNISDHSVACLPGSDVSRWLPRGGFQWQDSSVLVERSVERILWFEPIWDRLVKKEDAENSFSSATVKSVLAFSLGEEWKKGEFKGTDGNVNWSAKTKLDLKPGTSCTHLIAIVGEALGSAPSSENICSRLASKAAILQKSGDWNKALDKGKTLWIGFLQKVPKLKTEWPENIRKHYFKSWTVPFYNLIPATNLGHVNLSHPSVMCNRIAHGGFTVPASWEASLGALMLSYVMPDTAAEIIEGIYSSADEDGFIAEMIGGTRHTQLAYIEPCIALACVRNGADPAFLNRSWELMRRHFVYRMHHPNWRHMSNVSLRNTAYNYYSAKCMVALAKLLGRPSSEIARFEKGAKDAAIAVNAFWNNKDGGFYGYYDHIKREFVHGGDAESFITLAGVAGPEKRRQLLEIMRNHYLTENGAIRAYPVGLESVKAPNKKLANTILKCSNYFHVMPALHQLDLELARKVAIGTVQTIAVDGDFYEQQTLQGLGINNGPGSIFGAFGVVWPLMALDGLCDNVLTV